MKFRIYQPAKTAMQSGVKNTKFWILHPIENQNSRSINELMGWTSSSDTQTQLEFRFNSKEEAIKFAENKNYQYVVEEAKSPSIKKKSYSENFTKPVNL